MSDKEGVSISLLSGVKAAEDSLARGEIHQLENAIPDGHPLKDEIDKQKALMGGDLEGLPTGHPLFRLMVEAKQRYESEIADQTDTEQAKAREIRKAKKIEKGKAERKRRADAEHSRDERYEAAREANKGIEEVLGSMKNLYSILSSSEELMEQDPYCKMKLAKLKRLLFASERGLSECRITRMSDNG